MNPQQIAADDTQRAPRGRISVREFARVLALTRPYRKQLFLGILASVAFAGLQTAGLGAVFPVFKILLEQEGIRGWGHRLIAGDRLSVEFEPLDGAVEQVRVIRVHGPRAAETGLRAGVLLSAGAGKPVAALLETLAKAETGSPVPAVAVTDEGPREIALTPGPPDFSMRLLAAALSLLPADADAQKLRTLVYILAVMVFASLVGNVCRYLGEVTVAKAILRSLMDLRAMLYDKTLQLPMSFFASQPTSDIVTRFVQDIQEIQRGLITLFGKAIREPIRALFLLALALAADWRITITLAVAAPVIVLIFWSVGRRVKKANSRLLQAYGFMIDALTHTMHNLRVVKAYTAEEYEKQRLEAVDLRMFRQQVKLARLDAMVGPSLEALGMIAGSLVAVWLAGRVLDHELTPARFMTLGVILAMVFDPLRKLTDVFVRIQRSTAGAERVFQVIDERSETQAGQRGAAVLPLRERIEFVDVGFTYPGAPAPALCDIRLSIARGETLALVGPNGCGKSTLVSLLPRLFDPSAGMIRYDGTDLRQFDLLELRRQIGWVSQDAVVFAGTPIENIAYGTGTADRTRAEEAARRAFADEFIRALPGGYDSNLGERGTTLSGGQRQRLTIARAIYRNAPILVFDEATSQIDSESELKIQTAIRDFSRDRTTIIIAHRLSTIQFASRIVVMDAGQILDSGTHAELFARCALYRTLCETQLVGAAHAEADA